MVRHSDYRTGVFGALPDGELPLLHARGYLDLTPRLRCVDRVGDQIREHLLHLRAVADGHSVTEVGDGQRLLEYATSLRAGEPEIADVDLIVSDTRMPRFDAFEVVAFLRSASIRIPILLTTAFCDSHTHQKAEGMGVIRVLDKPFELDAFRGAVCDILFGHVIGVASASNEYTPAAQSGYRRSIARSVFGVRGYVPYAAP